MWFFLSDTAPLNWQLLVWKATDSLWNMYTVPYLRWCCPPHIPSYSQFWRNNNDEKREREREKNFVQDPFQWVATKKKLVFHKWEVMLNLMFLENKLHVQTTLKINIGDIIGNMWDAVTGIWQTSFLPQKSTKIEVFYLAFIHVTKWPPFLNRQKIQQQFYLQT